MSNQIPNQKSKTKKKLILTGGGTAGHVWPLLAVALELQKKPVDLVYVGQKGGVEEGLAKNAGLKFFGIKTGKWRRYFSWRNLVDLFWLKIGFFQSLYLLKKLKPALVFAKGGFVSLPMVLAAKIKKIPLVIHESDSVLGFVNQLAAKWAVKIFVSWPKEIFPPKYQTKMVETGNPLRRMFLVKKKPARAFFELPDEKMPVLLVMGGSLGASQINRLIAKLAPRILTKYQIIHAAGKNDLEWLLLERRRLPGLLARRWSLFGFLGQELADAFFLSDLVISRAGAGALAEIAQMAKPSILIPLPKAAADHQTKNAEIFAQNHAAMVLSGENLTSQQLFQEIEKLLQNPRTLARMAQAATAQAQPEAAQKVAIEIWRVLG